MDWFWKRNFWAVTLCFLSVQSASSAGLEPGNKTLFLVEENGDKHALASVKIGAAAKDGLQNYALEWDDAKFEEHFLSMRPFRCFEGQQKYWCRVPYPYEIRRQISAGDLTDLEYDTLFIWKGATEYGINMWNGVYYKLESVGDGALAGRLHEIDMERLAVPPEAGNLRPVREQDLEEGEPSSHWLPTIVIE